MAISRLISLGSVIRRIEQSPSHKYRALVVYHTGSQKLTKVVLYSPAITVIKYLYYLHDITGLESSLEVFCLNTQCNGFTCTNMEKFWPSV